MTFTKDNNILAVLVLQEQQTGCISKDDAIIQIFDLSKNKDKYEEPLVSYKFSMW